LISHLRIKNQMKSINYVENFSYYEMSWSCFDANSDQNSTHFTKHICIRPPKSWFKFYIISLNFLFDVFEFPIKLTNKVEYLIKFEFF